MFFTELNVWKLNKNEQFAHSGYKNKQNPHPKVNSKVAWSVCVIHHATSDGAGSSSRSPGRRTLSPSPPVHPDASGENVRQQSPGASSPHADAESGRKAWACYWNPVRSISRNVSVWFSVQTNKIIFIRPEHSVL